MDRSVPEGNVGAGAGATVGKIIDPATSQVIAGVRTDDGKSLADARTLLRAGMGFRPRAGANGGSVNVSVVGALAADAIADAIVRAATEATALGGLPAARDLGTLPRRLPPSGAR